MPKCINCSRRFVDQQDFDDHDCNATYPDPDPDNQETEMTSSNTPPLPNRPDVMCPCGSGKWFTQCHGAAQPPPAFSPTNVTFGTIVPPPTFSSSILNAQGAPQVTWAGPMDRASVMTGGIAPLAPPPITLKLDLAAGQSPRNGFEGVDIWPGAQHVVDLRIFPWPWKDSSVAELNCSHYIEHIAMNEVNHGGKWKDALFAFFDECYRILVPDGWLHLHWPFHRSDRAFQDPTHRRFIPAQAMLYMNRWWRESQKLDHYNVDCNFGTPILAQPGAFEGLSVFPTVDTALNLLHPEVANQRLLHFWNVGIDWEAKLQAKK